MASSNICLEEGWLLANQTKEQCNLAVSLILPVTAATELSPCDQAEPEVQSTASGSSYVASPLTGGPYMGVIQNAPHLLQSDLSSRGNL